MTHESSISLLSDDPIWKRGFECGVVYALMAGRCPRIIGAYDSCGDEQLLLLASQFGYSVQWQRMDGERTFMEFIFSEMDGQSWAG